MTQILFGSSLKVLAWVRAHMRSARYSRSLFQLSCCCPLPLYDEARAFGGGRGSPWHFPNRKVPVEMSLCRRRFRRCLLVVIFPFGKTSATEAPHTGCGERRCLLVVIFLSAKHLPRRHGILGAVSGGASSWQFSNRKHLPVKMSLRGRRFRRALFPSGKTSATGASPVGACEAGDRCRYAQFWDIGRTTVLLRCLEGMQVRRVFCRKQIPPDVLAESYPRFCSAGEITYR